ncbi:MAG: transposase [Tenericutes bacterium HGW-Tenericutes-6]|nr:MAG: transposase [Tenericutes bacterium HGW-Tenericutes-6]
MQKPNYLHEYFNPKQLKLPLSLDIKIPFDSEARTFDEVFSHLEAHKYLITRKDPRGRIGYNPVKMLKLILFCQMENITSLRDMAKAAQHDIRIMWLTDELKPSHQTISEFMNHHLKESIETLFQELNQYIVGKEKIDTEKLYIDGTKIEANANKYKFIWKGSIGKFRDKLFKKITKQIKAMNEHYEAMGIFFPLYEIYETDYLKRILDFLSKEVEQRELSFVQGKGTRKTALQRDYEKVSEYIAKLDEYNHYIEVIGPDRNSCARTDHDATFMHMKEDYMRNGQLKAGYNVQIGVSDEYILHLDIYQDRSDYQTFIPFLKGYHKRYGFYPKYPVADAGYGGLKNYRYLKDNEMKLYQKYTMYSKETNDKKYAGDPKRPVNFRKDEMGNFYDENKEKLIFLWHSKKGHDVYEVPSSKRRVDINEELWALQKEARENLSSELGIELRIQRSIQVEGAFGIIKEQMKFRRFKRRGIQNVKFEFMLTAIGYNLAKLHNKKYRILQ